VSTLHRVALALRVPITAFFEERPEPVQVILSRAQERRSSAMGAGPKDQGMGIVLESLGSGLDGQTLEPFVVTVQPGAGSGGQSIVHTGHELVYCLRGEIEYQVAQQPYPLAVGDALLFEARLPHGWRNRGKEPAAFLLVFQAAEERVSVEQHLQL
jgi:quercetin dioxygenase-like cupin family protein